MPTKERVAYYYDSAVAYVYIYIYIYIYSRMYVCMCVCVCMCVASACSGEKIHWWFCFCFFGGVCVLSFVCVAWLCVCVLKHTGIATSDRIIRWSQRGSWWRIIWLCRTSSMRRWKFTYVSASNKNRCETNTYVHTHTHTYIYIYIYAHIWQRTQRHELVHI